MMNENIYCKKEKGTYKLWNKERKKEKTKIWIIRKKELINEMQKDWEIIEKKWL